MTLLLAPYNDSMRLGMGFNSYTQAICIDNAVDVVESSSLVRGQNTAQVVTYSSRVVETLSDVVETLNISYCSSIKKGTVEVAGSANTVNEDKIKASDINAVVSVKVVNQTSILKDSCTFKPIKNLNANSNTFNDFYGDCYISGSSSRTCGLPNLFQISNSDQVSSKAGNIQGYVPHTQLQREDVPQPDHCSAELFQILSLRVLDRSKVGKVTTSVKQALSAGESSDFSLDPMSQGSGDAINTIRNNTESTIGVSWMGGGQIKEPNVPWDITSMFASAAAFPSRVETCPQRTWAILTKYTANRSFVEWSSEMNFISLEYDAVNSYTAELFENFMDYKQLLKLVQGIMANRDKYKTAALDKTDTVDAVQASKHNAISTEIPTLVAVRAALRKEMSKIVEAVDLLTRDPGILKRSLDSAPAPADITINSIIYEARYGQPQPQPGKDDAVEVAETSKDPAPDSGKKFDFASLIAPEVWEDVMPVPVSPTQADGTSTTKTISFLSFPPPPPPPAVIGATPLKKPDPLPPTPAPAPPAPAALKILSADIYGTSIASDLREKIASNQTLTLDAGNLLNLAKTPLKAQPELTQALTLIYDKDSDYPLVSPTAYTVDAWSVWAIVLNGQQISSSQAIQNVQDAIRQGYSSGSRFVRYITDVGTFNALMPFAPGAAKSLCNIYYQSTVNGSVKIASGIVNGGSIFMAE
ncbi:MAG: hypothetical protein M1824_003798 [Vezdaea acicularis]|nr:MAG: hypothetical protein M1824_003798 [Vezdaea acicularis]